MDLHVPAGRHQVQDPGRRVGRGGQVQGGRPLLQGVAEDGGTENARKRNWINSDSVSTF